MTNSIPKKFALLKILEEEEDDFKSGKEEQQDFRMSTFLEQQHLEFRTTTFLKFIADSKLIQSTCILYKGGLFKLF